MGQRAVAMVAQVPLNFGSRCADRERGARKLSNLPNPSLRCQGEAALDPIDTPGPGSPSAGL